MAKALLQHLRIRRLALEVDAGRNAVDITASCRLKGRTGVEMEAMTAVSVACLALYDLCKGLDRGVRIGSIELVHKSGGKSGTWQREPEA